jgi:hypothetical protein
MNDFAKALADMPAKDKHGCFSLYDAHQWLAQNEETILTALIQSSKQADELERLKECFFAATGTNLEMIDNAMNRLDTLIGKDDK